MTNHWQNINRLLPSGETLFIALIKTGDVSIISEAISHGADTNLRNSREINPIEAAIQGSNPKIVELLIQHGASVNTTSKIGSLPLEMALCHRNEDIVKLLLRYINKYCYAYLICRFHIISV